MIKETRGASGGGCIRKRSDGRWEGRYTLGYDLKSGKQKQCSIYGRTQKEVRQKLTLITSEIDERIHIEPSKKKLSIWLDEWLDNYTSDKKYSTVKGYRAQCETHIKPEIGNMPLCELTPVFIQKFINELSHETEDHKALSPKSIKNIHGVLSKALNQAVFNGMIRFNPCARVILPRMDKKEIQPLTEQQVQLFLMLAEEDELYGILLQVILLTGLRESEASGLTWDCVDFKRGFIKIDKQLQKRPRSAGGTQFSSTKSGRVRIIKPAPYVMSLLQKRKQQQEQHKKNAGPVWSDWIDKSKPQLRLVFTTFTGYYLSPQTIYNHFKVIADQIGAPNARVHDLRHTYAVLSLQNGDDIKTVQGNLGHATASFTLDVYGHVSDRMRDNSSANMENYLKNVLNI